MSSHLPQNEEHPYKEQSEGPNYNTFLNTFKEDNYNENETHKLSEKTFPEQMLYLRRVLFLIILQQKICLLVGILSMIPGVNIFFSANYFMGIISIGLLVGLNFVIQCMPNKIKESPGKWVFLAFLMLALISLYLCAAGIIGADIILGGGLMILFTQIIIAVCTFTFTESFKWYWPAAVAGSLGILVFIAIGFMAPAKLFAVIIMGLVVAVYIIYLIFTCALIVGANADQLDANNAVFGWLISYFYVIDLFKYMIKMCGCKCCGQNEEEVVWEEESHSA